MNFKYGHTPVVVVVVQSRHREGEWGAALQEIDGLVTYSVVKWYIFHEQFVVRRVRYPCLGTGIEYLLSKTDKRVETKIIDL